MHCSNDCYPHGGPTQRVLAEEVDFFSSEKKFLVSITIALFKSKGKLDLILLLLCVVSGLFI